MSFGKLTEKKYKSKDSVTPRKEGETFWSWILKKSMFYVWIAILWWSSRPGSIIIDDPVLQGRAIGAWLFVITFPLVVGYFIWRQKK